MIDSPSLVRGLRIGILGGSFNPAHDGHLEITHAARRALKLDRVWWLVSPQNPLKEAGQYLPLEERMARAKALTKGRAWLRVTDIETRLKTTYTADTLLRLSALYPDTKLVWIMGADNLAGFHRWERWQRIAQMMPLCVISRPGDDLRALKSPAARTLARGRIPLRNAPILPSSPPPAWVFLPMVHNPISATALRQAAQGV